MTIDKKREIIEEAFNYYHDRTALNNKEEKELLNFVNELYEAISVTHCCKSDSEQLQAVEDLKEFARNNCREWNIEEMQEIIDRL